MMDHCIIDEVISQGEYPQQGAVVGALSSMSGPRAIWVVKNKVDMVRYEDNGGCLVLKDEAMHISIGIVLSQTVYSLCSQM